MKCANVLLSFSIHFFICQTVFSMTLVRIAGETQNTIIPPHVILAALLNSTQDGYRLGTVPCFHGDILIVLYRSAGF